MESTHKIASFSQLPAEIYLIILAYAPIKGILRCRLLNRNLKSIIDNEKNRELLARQRVAAALDHLHTTVNNLNQSIFNLPILEALQVFIANRGLQPDPYDRIEDAKAFAHHRAGQMAKNGGTYIHLLGFDYESGGALRTDAREGMGFYMCLEMKVSDPKGKAEINLRCLASRSQLQPLDERVTCTLPQQEN